MSDTLQPARLLAALDATWAAAERAAIGEWIVRRGAGGGNRVSSVWPKGDPGAPVADAVESAVRIQRAWDQPPLFQIGPEDGALDALLEAKGWRAFDRTLMMTADPAAVAAHGLSGRMAVCVRCPLLVVDEIWSGDGVGPARRAVMARTPAPREVFLLREADRPAAVVFCAAADGVAMLHALAVAPAFRRRGVAASACAAVGRWAVEQGAETLALAVTKANEPARALYAKLGFVDAFAYHYRAAPDAAGSPR